MADEPSIELVCWDFDGTLWDNQPACARELAAALRMLGIDADTDSLWRDAHDGNPARHLFDFLRGRKNVGKVAKKPIEAWRFLRNMHEAAMVDATPFPVLDAYAFAAEHFDDAIVSSNKKKVIRRTLADHGIPEPGEYHCGKRSKRKKLKRIVKARGGPERLLLISDTTGDLRFADELGIPTLGAGWGLHGGARLRADGLAHTLGILDEPAQLLPALLDLRNGAPHGALHVAPHPVPQPVQAIARP